MLLHDLLQKVASLSLYHHHQIPSHTLFLQAQQALLTKQGIQPQPTKLGRLPDAPDSPHTASAEEASSMPILAVTLGADDNATASQAADSTTAEVASAVGVPMVSEAMRAEIMQLIWANFEVRSRSFQDCDELITCTPL